MFAYKKKVVPLQRQTKNDSVHVTLGYGVMVTQQILVLFFLVRIQVAQLEKAILNRVAFFILYFLLIFVFTLIGLSLRIGGIRLKVFFLSFYFFSFYFISTHVSMGNLLSLCSGRG